MMRARAAVALLALLLGLQPAAAQTPNFNFIVPTAPLGTMNNQAASTAFVQNSVAAGVSGVGSIGGAIGIITLGSGLSIPGNALTNTGVLSLGGSTGALTLGSGLSIPGGALTNSGVLSVGGSSGALALGSGLTISGVTLNTLAGGDACSGPRLAKTASYTVVNADRFSKFSLGGNAWFPLTFNVASGYDANFSACIHNTDAGRGKKIAVNGGLDFTLWPGQVAVIFNDNNTWTIRRPDRWRPTVSTVYVDFALGDDTANANDGLAPGAGNAWKTVEGALENSLKYFDANLTQVIIQMAAGSTDTVGVHWSPQHNLVGSQGGAAVLIDGNGGTISTAGSAMQFYFGARVQLRRLKLVSAGGSGLEVNYGARVEMLDGMEFGNSASSDMSIGDGGYIYFGQNYNISGTKGSFHISNIGGTVKATAIVTPFILNNITVNTFAFGQTPGTTDLSLAAYSTASGSVTGKKFNFVSNHAGFGAANIPGSVAGTWSGASSMDGVGAL